VILISLLSTPFAAKKNKEVPNLLLLHIVACPALAPKAAEVALESPAAAAPCLLRFKAFQLFEIHLIRICDVVKIW
jgi:hypothetical protein